MLLINASPHAGFNGESLNAAREPLSRMSKQHYFGAHLIVPRASARKLITLFQNSTEIHLKSCGTKGKAEFKHTEIGLQIYYSHELQQTRGLPSNTLF